MRKLLFLFVILCGCGGPEYVPPTEQLEPIEAGKYDVILTRTSGDCNYLPDEEDDVWYIHEDDSGMLYVYIQGVKIKSQNGTYFYGHFETGNEPCDVLIEIHADVSKTDGGFEGTVMVDVEIGGGACGNCADYADLVGTYYVDEEDKPSDG